MHHDGGVRHFTPAPDAVVVQRGDDTMVELSTFDPVRGRMVIGAPCIEPVRSGTLPTSSGSPPRPSGSSWLEHAGFHDVRFQAGGGGPLELDSWELVVVATA